MNIIVLGGHLTKMSAIVSSVIIIVRFYCLLSSYKGLYTENEFRSN